MDPLLLLKAAIMGVVEGLTEFLPISSTGHLILAGALLGMDDDKAKVFDIAIQTGAIFAVIIVYWQRLRDTLLQLPSSAQARRFALNVLIAFLPAVVLGLLFGKAIKAHLFTPAVVASTFILGGFIILWAERRAAAQVTAGPPQGDVPPLGGAEPAHKGPKGALWLVRAIRHAWRMAAAARRPRGLAVVRIHTVDDMGPLDALKVGLAQCLAMIPGTSRSGATIIGGMLLGLSRKAATDFSFFLAIPTLVGAGLYSLYKERALLSLADLPVFLVGLVFAFISAYACVRWLLRYIASHSFVPFAWYRIAFGGVVLLTAAMGWVHWGD